MNSNYNYTNGENCHYNFYVIAFDSQNEYKNYGDMKADLTFSEARAEYKKAVSENPRHVNTMLGVSYMTDRYDLEPAGAGAVDLLQHIDGQTRLSSDYAKNPVLKNESLIKTNVINILKKDIEKQKDYSLTDKDKRPAEKSTGSLIGKLRRNENKLKSHNRPDVSVENQRII